MNPQPIQPLVTDDNGVLRFRRNDIVRYLLDNASKFGFDMHHLATKNFSREDEVQFAQLIGCSFGGFSDLSYVTEMDCEAAEEMMRDPLIKVQEAVLRVTNSRLEALQRELREPIAKLYGIHPDDLKRS